MTIDELAQRAGTTSRNIRAYQERGLLPPPRLVGRTGYYGEGHVARLRHIAQLLERGFSLASIRELFDAWERGYGLAEVLGFEEALDATWEHEAASRVFTREELDTEFGLDDEALRVSVDLGFVIPEDGGYRVPSPQVLSAGRQLIDVGIPSEALLEEAARLHHDLDRIAERWVTLFLDHVWAAYVDGGMSPDQLHDVSEALTRMRPLALMTVEPLLAQAMKRRVAAAAAETLAAPPRPARRRGGRRVERRNAAGS